MGVAIDDLDGNNLLDLFVTNFQDESNTLYLQDAPGLFTDATKKAGLQAVSIPYTGWGTQTLDADLDGLPDLIVANGHVDDGRVVGRDYHQRPQFFQNRGGRFQELASADVGPWFGELHLGRGLARVDWNLDGLPDFIVSLMNAPLAVMKNTSVGTGHFLRVQLRATETARDAIGATVTIEFDGKTVTRQLLAGDGYMASNERVVEFGLGSSANVDTIRIDWPSGATSTAMPQTVDSTFIVVEGTDTGTVVEQSGVSSIRVTTRKPGSEGAE